MRIIDKNHDFYDYLQDSTDTLVFDRRGSYLLTKERLCNEMNTYRFNESQYRFVLLQCGATFWLFLATITERSSFGSVKNFETELLHTWKNFDKPNELLKVDIIGVNYIYKIYNYKVHDYVYDLIKENTQDIVDAINRNNISIIAEIGKYERVERNHFPLIKASGLTNCIDPQTMFCAVEEYFSIEKTKAETTEAKGTTNDIKITSHGFDTKTSFRNIKIKC